MNNEQLAVIHSEMSVLFTRNKNFLDSNTAKSIAEYISVGEWGLALELFVFCVEREALPLSESDRQFAYDLALRMNLDLDQIRSEWPGMFQGENATASKPGDA